MTNKTKNNAPGLDLVSPFVEIIHELGTELVKGIFELAKFLYKKWNKNYFEISKIEEKHLYKNKQTKNPTAIGYSTSSKRELPLSEIDFSKHSFIVGAAGFGKTNLISLLQEHSLQSKKPIIFIDPKGDLEALETLRDDNGNIIYERDAENRIKQKLYDDRNNLTQMIIGTGASKLRININYDPTFSVPVSIEEINGAKTLFTLDAHGNVISSVDNKKVRNFYEYNNRGQLIAAKDSAGNQTTLRYFADGNLSQVEDPQGNISNFTYDLAGNITKIVDAKNNVTLFEYDIMNRLLKTTNANNEVTKFSYDYKGNLLSVTDSRNQVTLFEYDAENRMTKRTDPLGISESFEYDLEGNLLSHTDRKGQSFGFTYNAANELVKKILPDNTTTSMTYDLAGNLKTIENNFSKLTYSYDDLNQVASVSTDGSPYQPSLAMNYSFYHGMKQGFGSRLGGYSFIFDTQDRVTGVRTSSNKTINFNYDNQGRRSSIVFPNSITTNLNYDESSRLAKIAHQKNGVDMLSYSYAHDKNGNRTQMNVTSPVTEALSQVNYTYDSVNQLLSATKSVQSNTDESFTYDNLGNRLKKNSQSTSNVYDNNNRIISDETYNYTHDDNGNMIKKVNRSTGYTYKYFWDFENKLQYIKEYTAETSSTPVKTHTYLYDVYGRRILKDSNGTIHKYIYDDEDIAFEFDNNDNLVSKFSHGPGIDEPLEIVQNGNTYYYHIDGLGSITGISDSNGNIVQSYAYSSFGETKVFNQSGTLIDPTLMTVKSPYGYTSREWDFETGLNFHRARYYDPRIGRFISEDPSGFGGNNKNLYRYVGNRPTIAIDPDGNVAHIVIGAAVGGLYSSITALLTGQDPVKAFYSGAIAGAVSATLGPFGGAITNIILDYYSQKFNTKNACFDQEINYWSLMTSGVLGYIGGRLGQQSVKGMGGELVKKGFTGQQIGEMLKTQMAKVSGIFTGSAEAIKSYLFSLNWN